MESNIILEGFRMADRQHGVRYIKFIGDGDSSVHAQLISGISGWGYAIQKQECASHAVKCFQSSLEKLMKDNPQYKGIGKLTEQMRKRLASSIRCAIINRSKMTEKKITARLLQKINCALHCFSSHHNCSDEYCKVVKNLKSGSSTEEETSSSLSISISHSSLVTSSDHTDTSVTQCLPDSSDTFSSESQSNSDSQITSDFLSASDTLSFSSLSTFDSLSTSTIPDDTLNPDLSLDTATNEEIENDSLDEILQERQIAWKMLLVKPKQIH